MGKQLRMVLISIAVLTVLLVSAVHPLGVLADDSTPAAPASPAAGDTSAPATQAPSTANTSAPAVTQAPLPADTSAPAVDATQPLPATDTSVPAITQAPPTTTDTSAPAVDATQPPPATDTSAPATTVASTDTAVAPTDSSAPATATALAQVPTGTPVVVLDATGTAVPLATQAAADIIQSGDPIWCPGNDAPNNGSCTAPETSVTNLIAVLGTKSGAGTIYFEPTYSATDATFDPTISANLSGLTDLTIQGGWNGSTSSPVISGVTTFNGVPLAITHWNGNVTLNDITVTGITTGIGLTVIPSITTSGKGNIALHNVKSNNNTGHGAFLSNTAGNGNITIDSVSNDGSSGSSEFNGNTKDGSRPSRTVTSP